MNIKEWQRPVLLIGMAVVGVLLLMEWNQFQADRAPVIETETTLSSPVAPIDSNLNSASPPVPANNESVAQDSSIPVPAAETVPATAPTQVSTAAPSQLINIKTDVFDVSIDTLGGDIVKVALPKFPVTQDQPDVPLILLNRTNSTIYVAQSGLVGQNGTDVRGEPRPTFTTRQTSYAMASGEDSLAVDLVLNRGEVEIIKRFTFTRGDNFIGIDYIINNNSASPWVGNFYGQFRRDDHKPAATGPGFGIQSFTGAATTVEGEPYKRFSFDDLSDGEFAKEFRGGLIREGGWMAMVQHYFVSAWVPPQDQTNNYFANPLSNSNQYLFGYTGPSVRIPAGQQGTISSGFYSGPKDIHRLEELAPNLDRTLDFSWLFFVARPMFVFLLWLHGFVGNWGVAIILLVVCVKIIFYPLASAGYRSMAKMKLFAPKMQELKERYGDNKQKFSEEMMKLYKKEGVNPVGGCLPMLLQIPVFIALYWVILEAVDLRHAPFVLWIDDLSVKDPFFILPLLYGVTMWFQQKLNPTVGDPTQQKIMQMMPFVFTFMFLFFQSGLVLYWVVNALLGILQQWYITRQIEKAQGAKKA